MDCFSNNVASERLFLGPSGPFFYRYAVPSVQDGAEVFLLEHRLPVFHTTNHNAEFTLNIIVVDFGAASVNVVQACHTFYLQQQLHTF